MHVVKVNMTTSALKVLTFGCSLELKGGVMGLLHALELTVVDVRSGHIIIL